MCSLPPGNIHVILVIEFAMNQISSCGDDVILFFIPASFHKRGKSSLCTNTKNLSSKLTNLTNTSLSNDGQTH